MIKKIILVLIVAAAAVFAGLAVHDYLKEKNAGQIYEEAQEEYKITPTPTPEPVVETPEPTPTPEPVQVPIDFKSLQEANPDIYAWITIPNTLVDYPILQNPDDDDYYLHRNMYGQDEYAGALYTQATYNTKDFEKDPVTVVYGHAMKNGTMLRGIKDYMDKDFFDNNKEILVYTPDSILHYQVFAGYIYDDRLIPEWYNFDTPEGLKLYIQDIYDVRDMSSNFDMEMKDKLDENSKILTLSTCYDADSVQRYLLQAVLVEAEH